MFMSTFAILIVAFALIYRKPLMESILIFFRLGLYVQFIAAVLILAAVVLIFPGLTGPRILPFAYLYALGLTALQSYRIFKQAKMTGRFFHLKAVWPLLGSLLVIATPLADIALGRDYPEEAAVLIGASSLTYLGLYIVEVGIAHPEFEEKKTAPKAP